MKQKLLMSVSLTLSLFFSITILAKGENRLKSHQKGTIRGTEVNPVVKGIEDVVNRLNITWASLKAKEKNIKDFSGLQTDQSDLIRYQELNDAFTLDKLTYRKFLEDLNKKLANTFSRVDDADIYKKLKHLQKYETKENFIYLSKITEWMKTYEERAIKQKEIASDSNTDGEKQPSNSRDTKDIE
ncbi:MAG: hypothetical protein AAF518_17955 [Spirochaetota bacterium]